jgi:formate hydrogenlyase subunit 4
MISLLFIAITALFFTGVIVKVKAKIGARKMPSILQPLYDLIRLFKKGAIYSTTTSIIFKIAPIIYMATVLVAMLFIPVVGQSGLLSFEGDFVFFAYLLAMGKFMLIISAMDTGSGFEGMGANREALYSMLVEPAFFILAGSLALFTNNASFHDLYFNLQISTHLSFIIGITAIYVLFYIALIENSRLPVDDPKTHLELTMVHEVMILDNSGFDLALMHLAGWLKFAIYGSLIANFIIPAVWPIYLQLICYLFVQFIFAFTVGLVESFRARNKMEKNPQWIIMLSAIAIITFLTTLIITNKIILN